MDLTSLSRTILGLTKGVELLRERSKLNLPLPKDVIEGEEIPIDACIVELWLRQTIDDLCALEKMVPRERLLEEDVLARQTCSAVFVCRDLFLGEQNMPEAKELVASYHDISELCVSPEAKLTRINLSIWLNLDCYEDLSQVPV